MTKHIWENLLSEQDEQIAPGRLAPKEHRVSLDRSSAPTGEDHDQETRQYRRSA